MRGCALAAARRPTEQARAFEKLVWPTEHNGEAIDIPAFVRTPPALVKREGPGEIWFGPLPPACSEEWLRATGVNLNVSTLGIYCASHHYATQHSVPGYERLTWAVDHPPAREAYERPFRRIDDLRSFSDPA